MLTVIHTFNAPDQDRVLAEVRDGLQTVEDITGFKYASVNKQEQTNNILMMSKWENRQSFENWAHSIGENNAFRQATPQIFEVLQEKY